MSFFALRLSLLLLALEGQLFTQHFLPSAYIYTNTRFHNPMIPLAICIRFLYIPTFTHRKDLTVLCLPRT